MIRPLCAQAGIGWEHALRGFAKSNRDDALTLGEAFAGAQIEGHAGPAPVVDEAAQRDKGFGVRILRDAGFEAVARILPAHDVGWFDRQHAAKYLVLLL